MTSALPLLDSLPAQAADNRLIDALRLIRSENVGPITYHQLVSYYGSAAKALDALPELSRRGGRKKAITICPKANAEKEIEAIQSVGAQFLIYGTADYPELLTTIPDAPPVLTALGNPAIWRNKTVLGVVGARNASANGCAMARKLAQQLGQHDYIIASGLARGVDTAAHLGSLETGTVAVIAGGIDVIYPPENESLYRKIIECGAILAEAPFGTAPIARHFPARNRIIAGMSVGVAVIEASLKSGSLITAHDALDYGREVFAVPGSPLDPRCKGSNDLIRHGATLTESAQDILDNLHGVQKSLMREPKSPHFAPAPPGAISEQEMEIYRRELVSLLGPDPVLLDELLVQCHISPSLFYTLLLELELAGRLARHPGGRVSLEMEV